MLGKYGSLIRQARLAKRDAYGAAYEQQAVAERLGLVQSWLSQIELDKPAALPAPEVLNALANDLAMRPEDAPTLMASWIEAAGYEIGGEQGVSQATKKQMAESTELADYLRYKFGLVSPDLIENIMFLIEGRRQRQREESGVRPANEPRRLAERQSNVP